MKYKKIFICGPSGVGKTTLAKFIAAKYNIPFVSTSGKLLWRDYGITSHKDLLDKSLKDPTFAVNYQFDLLKQRRESLSDLNEFVTDRSPVDNLVYFMLEASKSASLMESATYLNSCRDALMMCDLLINIQFSEDIDMEDDGMRIVNPLFQEGIQAIFDRVIKQNLLDSEYITDNMEIDYWDWEQRKKNINKVIMGKTGFFSFLGL